jgi:hypothetical protein
MTRYRFATALALAPILATALPVGRAFSSPTSSLSKEHRMSSLADIQAPEGLRARTNAIDVFEIAQNIRVRTTIRPDSIETFSEAQKHRVTDPHEIAALYSGLERSKPIAAKQAVEYRWKIVAYDAKGERIAEIYLSAITRYGMLGDGELFVLANDDFQNRLAALAKSGAASQS